MPISRGNMNRFQNRLTLWMLAFCLVLPGAISPVLAKAQAISTDSSSDASTKKPKKRAKRAAEADSASKTAGAGKSAPADSTGNITAPEKTTTMAAATASSPEIAAAQASGKVWVNTDSGVYHKGGRWYDKTKAGKVMTESETEAAGYKAAHKE